MDIFKPNTKKFPRGVPVLWHSQVQSIYTNVRTDGQPEKIMPLVTAAACMEALKLSAESREKKAKSRDERENYSDGRNEKQSCKKRCKSRKTEIEKEKANQVRN